MAASIFEGILIISTLAMLLMILSIFPYILAFVLDLIKAFRYKRKQKGFSTTDYLGKFNARYYQKISEKQIKHRVLYSGLGLAGSRCFSKFFEAAKVSLGIALIYLILKELKPMPGVFEDTMFYLGILYLVFKIIIIFFQGSQLENSFEYVLLNLLKWLFIYWLIFLAVKLSTEACFTYLWMIVLLRIAACISEKTFLSLIASQWEYVNIVYFELYWHQLEYSKLIKTFDNELMVITFSEVWLFKYGGKLIVSTESLKLTDGSLAKLDQKIE